MPMADVSILEVVLHGATIGTLTRLPDDRVLFAFDQGYIDDQARDTLSLSFKDSFGGLLTETRPTRTRVAPFFANLLPEGPLRDYLAGRAGVNPRREFFLLWALGQDLPGALLIRPADGDALPPPADDRIDAAADLVQLEAWAGAPYVSDTIVHVGTAAGTVELLGDIRGVDGVTLRPLALPSTLPRLVENVLPVIRPVVAPATGTLRDRLGLPRPANRFASAH